MIKFFRHIRQRLLMENKTSKYFKYAIGEIVLVVIGILIALQINNWNENRKEEIRQVAILSKFLQDLKSDSINYQLNISTMNQIDSLHQRLFRIIENGPKNVILEKPIYIRRALMDNPIAKENNPDITSNIDNDKIRESIQGYFRIMNQGRQAIGEFEKAVMNIREYMRSKGTHNLKGWFRDRKLNDFNVLNKEDLSKRIKEIEFQQLLFEASLKLHESRGVVRDSILGQNGKLMTQIRDFLKQ